MELSRAEKFFEGEEIAYESSNGNSDFKLLVKVTMKDAKVSPWKNGVDYIYEGGIKVDKIIGRNSKAEWGHGYFTFSCGGGLGELFQGLSEKADRLYRLLSMGEIKSDERTRDCLTRCLFEIEEQAKREFLQKNQHNGSFLRQDLYGKYAKPHISERTDD